MQGKKVIIIGAGIAGIATSIRLAVMGYDVEVFEKNDVAGGKMYLIEKGGFTFDAGPSLFTQPINIEELFAFANEPIDKYFQYSKVDIACKYHFENGKRINAFTRPADFASEMNEKTGEPVHHIIRYLKNAERVYEKVGSIFLNFSLHRFSTWFHPRVLVALKTIKLSYLFNTLDTFNRKRFVTPEAVQIFNRFATYNGSNPYKAPGMLSLIPHLEQNEGTFYPIGGMISIPDALTKLARHKGVKFNLGRGVDKIILEGSLVKGVLSEGEFNQADIVVSNVDAYYTYKNLIEDKRATEKVLRHERSSSALIFYWGMNKKFPDLHLHNIFFSTDYDAEFKHLFELKRFYVDPTIYINITSKMESVHAPEGKENWFVMVNAPATEVDDWKSQVEEVRASIVKKLNRMLGVELDDFIEIEEVLTPSGIQQRTDSFQGSLYGTSSNSVWSAFLRHANFSSHIQGLYFAGGSVHPGGGIPLCLKGAKIVAELIGKKDVGQG